MAAAFLVGRLVLIPLVGIPVASLAVTLSGLVGRRHASRVLGAAAAALCAGVCLAAFAWRPEGLGQLTGQIHRAEGILVSDGRPTVDGRGVYELTAPVVTGVAGSTSVDRASLTVITDNFVPMPAGARLGFPCRLGSDRPVCFAGASELRRLPAATDAVIGFREDVLDAAHRAALGADPTGLLSALLYGRRDALAPRTVDSFRRAGASHILALSGMHLGILAGGVVWILGRLIGRRFALAASVPLVLCYVLLVGPSPSIVRSLLFFSLAAATRVAGRRMGGLQVLSVTFLIMALAYPAWVGRLSFQYSFLALSGILLVGEPLARVLRGRLPDLVLVPLAASLGAQLATALVSLVNFGELYPVGVLSSLLLGPPIALLMIAGALLSPIHGAALLIEPLSRIIGEMAGFFAGTPALRPPAALLPLVAAAATIPPGLVLLRRVGLELTLPGRRRERRLT